MADEPNRQISQERKFLYYGGMGCAVAGFLLFLSNFFLGPKVGGGATTRSPATPTSGRARRSGTRNSAGGWKRWRPGRSAGCC